MKPEMRVNALALVSIIAAVAGDEASESAGHGVCEDKHPECENWAKVGECDANPAYMLTSCAVSCKTCHLSDPRTRCKRTEGQAPVLAKAGDLDRLLQRALEEQQRLTAQLEKVAAATLAAAEGGDEGRAAAAEAAMEAAGAAVQQEGGRSPGKGKGGRRGRGCTRPCS